MLKSPIRYFSFITFTALYSLITPNIVHAQQPIPAPDWGGFQFMMGDWIGEGGGAPGQGTGWFSFTLDLQQRILIRKNHSDFPAQNNRPAFTHDDLMIVYPEAGKKAKAIYFDNEGHVIQYAIEISDSSKSVVFISEASPPTPRFRLTYTLMENDRLKIDFDFAPPGKPETFSRYIESYAKRKK